MPFLHFPFLLHALRQGIRDRSDIGLIYQYISGYPTLSEIKNTRDCFVRQTGIFA